jgi:hypothetical protein
MSDLVDLPYAYFHMRISDEVSPDRLEELLEDAEGLIANYLGYPISERWPDYEGVPVAMRRAVCVVALDLFDNSRTPLGDMEQIRNLVGRYKREGF